MEWNGIWMHTTVNVEPHVSIYKLGKNIKNGLGWGATGTEVGGVLAVVLHRYI